MIVRPTLYFTTTEVDRICGVWLSLCVCVRLASASRVGRLVSRLSRVRLASASRVGRLVSRLSRVCVSRLRAFVSRASRVLSRVCLASACICLASRVPNACVCVCLASVSHLSRVCLASVVLSRVCLASVRLSRVCLSPCECLRELAHFMSVVIQRVQKVFAIVILSYNVPMPKYPSHHLIYVFYHPMPIMPLY